MKSEKQEIKEPLLLKIHSQLPISYTIEREHLAKVTETELVSRIIRSKIKNSTNQALCHERLNHEKGNSYGKADFF